jgi:hypothetical protein
MEATVLSVKLCGKKWAKQEIKVHANSIKHPLKNTRRLAILRQYLLKKRLNKFNRKRRHQLKRLRLNQRLTGERVISLKLNRRQQLSKSRSSSK